MIDSEILDLTDKVKDGWLLWDVPEGVWRICVSFTTYDFGANNEYINYVDRDSVAALIEAVIAVMIVLVIPFSILLQLKADTKRRVKSQQIKENGRKS